MFGKIIIISDLLLSVLEMTNFLKEFKKFGVDECLLLQCLTSKEADSALSSTVSDIYKKALDEQKEALSEQGFLVNTRILLGDIIHELNRISEEDKYNLVVVGSAKNTLFGEIIFSDNACNLIHYSNKPILLVRVSENLDEAMFNPKKIGVIDHILFPTDFSDNASLAFEYVEKFVEKGISKVTVVHVQNKAKVEPYLQEKLKDFNDAEQNNLQVIKDRLLAKGATDVNVELLYGKPSLEITKLINSSKIPLVVMGTQGRGLVEEIFLGSVSHNIARYSDASVLLIPPKVSARHKKLYEF